MQQYCHLSKEVVTVECISDLAQSAQERLSKLEYENVKVIQGDGKEGYKDRDHMTELLLRRAVNIHPGINRPVC